MTTPPETSPSESDRLILEAAEGTRRLTPEEIRRVLVDVAAAGFDPHARERVRGRLAGLEWQGTVLRGSDRLPSAEVHYLRHVVAGNEWPPSTTLADYLRSIRQVVLDRRSGILASRYQGTWQLTVIRRSREWRGPEGFDWILVDYRVEIGHWVTAFQPREGLRALRQPNRKDSRWLRQPR